MELYEDRLHHSQKDFYKKQSEICHSLKKAMKAIGHEHLDHHSDPESSSASESDSGDDEQKK